jgi:XRE family aerobic/anaerobic benzoate catabolism transcriptional regulator
MSQQDAALKPEDERDFLVEVGRRVRHCRHAISMTRKQLAERSGLSERYLAQLEAGDGNISILLIRRVARVLRVDLPRLVAEPAEQLTSRPTRIALLSMSSPSAVAALRDLSRSLATALAVPLLDIGREVRDDLGAEAPDALQQLGAEVCRDAQRRALLRLTASHRRCVLALGDLPAADSDLMRLLHQRCVTVWLRQASPDDAEFIQADHWVETEARTPEQVLASVMTRIEHNFRHEPAYGSRVTDRPGPWSRSAA